MTYEETVKAALMELAAFGEHFPSSRAALYRRIGVRQQQLFAMAAGINPDWAGVCLTASLENGVANLRTLILGTADPLPPAEHISRVEVLEPGVSDWLAGEPVTLVPSDDPSAGLAPRMHVRDWVFRSVGAELDGVVSIRVHYSRVPPVPAVLSAQGTSLEIAEPHTEVLVFDVAAAILQRAAALRVEVPAGAVEFVKVREAEAVEAFRQHVAGAVATANRFARVA